MEEEEEKRLYNENGKRILLVFVILIFEESCMAAKIFCSVERREKNYEKEGVDKLNIVI